jgi:hypothetical protein
MCREVGVDLSQLERYYRAAEPHLVLFMGSDAASAQERALRAATVLHDGLARRSGGPTDREPRLCTIDFANINEHQLTKLFDSLAWIRATESTVVALSVDRLLDLIDVETARRYFAALRSLQYGAVGTANPAPHGAFLSDYFDLVINRDTDAMQVRL